MSNWVFVKAIEDLAVLLLLFTLLTACATRWRSRKRAVGVSAGFGLTVLGLYAATGIFFLRILLSGIDFWAWLGLNAAMFIGLLIGFIWIARNGWRRTGTESRPAATGWPRLRLVLAAAVALMLNAVTYWNLQLAVLQRLAGAEVEAQVLLLSVMPGRPIDSLNAAILYTPLFDRLENAENYPIPKEWADFDKALDTTDPELRRLLAEHKDELRLLRKAAERSHCYFQDGVPVVSPIEMRMDGHTHLMQAAHLMAADTRVQLAEGEQEVAVANTITLFRMARHAAQDSMLIAILVSIAIEDMGLQCLEALLNHNDLSADQLRALQLEGDVAYRRELQRAFIIEEAGAIFLSIAATEQGLSIISALMGGEEPDAVEDFMWYLGYPFFIDQELGNVRSRHRDIRAALELPGPKLMERLDELTSRAAVREVGLLGALLIPHLDRAAQRIMIRDARHRLARVAVAMRHYELDHGDQPETLEALAPTYLDAVPMDPFTEEPFQTEPVEDGLRLYSAGIEAMDLREGEDQKQVKVEMVLKTPAAAQ